MDNNYDNNSSMEVSNKKCNEHITEDIVAICIQCDNIPVCMKCIIGKGEHNAHKIGEINNETVDPILKELRTITIPKLNESLKQSKSQLVEYDNQLEIKYTENTHKIKSTFQKLHNKMTAIERDLIRQLDTTLDENRDIHSAQHSSFDNNNKLIDMLNTKYSPNNNQYNSTENLKHNHQSKQLLFAINNSSSHFKQSQLDENISNKNEINNSIKSFFTIKANEVQQKIHPIQQIPLLQPVSKDTNQNLKSKEVKLNYYTFLLCREGVTFKEGSCYFAADYYSKLSTASFPSSAHTLFIFNEFNESLESIPKSITTLFISSINCELVPGSIPNHIAFLILCDGFYKTITKGVIPPSVCILSLGNIVKPLGENSIPNSLAIIQKSSSFKHFIKSKINLQKGTDYGKYEYV